MRYDEFIEISIEKSEGCLIYWGHAVVQLNEALSYKSEGREFESRWCQWNFSLT